MLRRSPRCSSPREEQLMTWPPEPSTRRCSTRQRVSRRTSAQRYCLQSWCCWPRCASPAHQRGRSGQYQCPGLADSRPPRNFSKGVQWGPSVGRKTSSTKSRTSSRQGFQREAAEGQWPPWPQASCKNGNALTVSMNACNFSLESFISHRVLLACVGTNVLSALRPGSRSVSAMRGACSMCADRTKGLSGKRVLKFLVPPPRMTYVYIAIAMTPVDLSLCRVRCGFDRGDCALCGSDKVCGSVASLRL